MVFLSDHAFTLYTTLMNTAITILVLPMTLGKSPQAQSCGHFQNFLERYQNY